jgi:hypothetical protein
LLKRRSALVGAAAALAVAGGIAAGIVVAVEGTGEPKTSRATYIEQVNAICAKYGPQLDRITPPDISSPGDVLASIDLALPLLTKELQQTRAVEPPEELRPQLDRFLALSDRTLRELEIALRAAERHNFSQMGMAFLAFQETLNRAQKLSKAIGFHC